MGTLARRRFWVQAGLAALASVLILLTLLWRDWIEVVFGIDPDHGDGSVEWLIVATLLAIAAALAVAARLEWRRATATG
jgi:hypothetical protein